ncbi:MAG: type II CAAX endopeptidase family protein [Candidatus Omnitrophota bacterium]
MGRIADIVRRNKLYLFLTVFILGINLMVLVDSRLDRPPGERAEDLYGAVMPAGRETEPEGPEIFDPDDLRARQEKLQSLARGKPLLYVFLAIVNLTVMFMILVGLIIDIYFSARFFRKKPPDIRVNPQPAPLWGVPDILRVTIIFLSFAYLFAVLQAFAIKKFAVLGNQNFNMVFNTSLANIVGISVILYFVRKKYGQGVSALGLTVKGAGKSVFYGIIGYLALIPVLILIMALTYAVTKLIKYQPPVQPIVELFMKEKETSVLWMSTVFAAVFGPVAEEIFFRGFIYGALKKNLGVFGGILVTALLFSALHAHIVGLLPILALGILLSYLYEKTGSLAAPITVHIIHNLGMVFLVFLVRMIGL